MLRTSIDLKFIDNSFKIIAFGCATPTIQGLLAIDKLLEINFIDKQDIIINGNSGDFITGGHIPLINSNIKKFDNQNTMLDNILDIHINKHYALWDSLLQEKNKKLIKKLLLEQIKNHNINLNNIDMIEGLWSFLNFIIDKQSL